MFIFYHAYVYNAYNGNSSKKVKATDFKFDVHVSRDSPDITP